MGDSERCIDDEIPFEIPESWVWTRLSQIAELQTGTTPATTIPEYYGKGISFIKPGDIYIDHINYDNESLTLLGASKSRIITANSVLMVCIGGSIGKCYYTEQDICCNQQINSASPYFIDVHYLWYTLSSDMFQGQIHDNSGGTATPIINKNLWGQLYIPIPPLAEQQRIVYKLNEAYEHIK